MLRLYAFVNGDATGSQLCVLSSLKEWPVVAIHLQCLVAPFYRNLRRCIDARQIFVFRPADGR